MNIAIYHNLGSGGAKRSLYERVCRLVSRHSVDVFTTMTSDLGFCDLRPFAGSHCSYAFAPRRLFRSPIGRLYQLQELAERLGVELRIELSVSQDQLIGRLQDARLFAYAPRKEPFGPAALEAMACRSAGLCRGRSPGRVAAREVARD